MFPLNFRKSTAEKFLECLAEGKPLGVVHTIDEMIGLAGACFFAIQSHGPLLRKVAAEAQGLPPPADQAAEHKEADDEMIRTDTLAAIEFAGYLTMLVKDGEYDDRCEETVGCLVGGDEGHPQVMAVAGFKKAK